MLADGRADRFDWMILPILSVLDHVMHSGDLSLAAEHFDLLLTSHVGLELISEEDALVHDSEALVDWPAPMQDGYVKSKRSTVSSAWFHYGATSLARLARLLGRDANASFLEERAAATKASMNRLQFNGTAFCDGVCAETPHTSFHSTMYALAFGAVDVANLPAAQSYLRERALGPEGPPCSSYTVQFALSALYDLEDLGEAGLAVLRGNGTNSWQAMLRQNATMTMEMWNPEEKSNLDWSHPWSSSPAFVVPWNLFGIQPLVPGFEQLQVLPQVGSLEYGEYELRTICGALRASFEQRAAAPFRLNVSLPSSATATLGVPAQHENGASQLLLDGKLVSAERRGQFLVVDGVGPGGDHVLSLPQSLLV